MNQLECFGSSLCFEKRELVLLISCLQNLFCQSRDGGTGNCARM